MDHNATTRLKGLRNTKLAHSTNHPLHNAPLPPTTHHKDPHNTTIHHGDPHTTTPLGDPHTTTPLEGTPPATHHKDSRNTAIHLEGKRIIITGGDGGVGSVLVEKLAAQGADCTLICHSEKDDCPYPCFCCDLSSQHDVLELTKHLKNEYATIDGIIHAAGIGIYKDINELAIDEWNHTLAVNLTAPFIITKELIPHMTHSQLSLVLSMGSGAGVIPMPGRSAYCSSKFGLRGLMLSLSEEHKGRQPSFCLMTFGSILTNFGPMTVEEKKQRNKDGNAYFTPEWVADTIITVMKNGNRKDEYTLYPSDYGVGQWRESDQYHANEK